MKSIETINQGKETPISEIQEEIAASLIENSAVRDNLRDGRGGDVTLLLIEQKLAEFGILEPEPSKITRVANFMDTAEKAVRYRIERRQYNTIVDEVYLRLQSYYSG